jgi:hypothetical protein
MKLLQSSIILPARLIRRTYRQWVQLRRYKLRSLQGVPILFANSFPKSGTHLLTQILQGFTSIGPAVDSGLPAIVTFEGETGRQQPISKIMHELERLEPGDIAYGHLHALPAVLSFICQSYFAAYFIYRDPRDVVVSHVYYVTEMSAAHAHHQFYTQELHSFAERLNVSILGRPDWAELFPNIRARFEPYLIWVDHPQVLALRYEDFISDRQTMVGQILDHAVSHGFPLSCERILAIQELENHIKPEQSPTFRSGKSGGWREHFTPDHKKVFKEVAGDLLIRLGYESNFDW